MTTDRIAVLLVLLVPSLVLMLAGWSIKNWVGRVLYVVGTVGVLMVALLTVVSLVAQHT